jgi:GNAT superfamily N-acetyltransferase
MTVGLSIRWATEADIPVVLSFIRELAAHQRLAHEVVSTEDDLREALFGVRPTAEVLIGLWDNYPVSFALFYPKFSTFLGKPGIYLEDLYVKPDWRGKGVGQEMLRYLARLATERRCGRLEWMVVNWNASAIAFYKKLGAVPMDDWTVFRVTGESLTGLGHHNASMGGVTPPRAEDEAVLHRHNIDQHDRLTCVTGSRVEK